GDLGGRADRVLWFEPQLLAVVCNHATGEVLRAEAEARSREAQLDAEGRLLSEGVRVDGGAQTEAVVLVSQPPAGLRGGLEGDAARVGESVADDDPRGRELLF